MLSARCYPGMLCFEERGRERERERDEARPGEARGVLTYLLICLLLDGPCQCCIWALELDVDFLRGARLFEHVRLYLETAVLA